MRTRFIALSVLLLVPLLVGLTCGEWTEIPGRRTPLGDVSRDHWEPLESPVASPVYLAAGGGLVLVGSQDSLAVSTDGGESWKTILVTGITSVAMEAESPARIVVSGASGVYVSTDGGASFTNHPTPDAFHAVLVHPTLSDHLFAISDTALWRSEDNGATWSLLYTPPESPKLTHFAVDKRDTSYFYLIDGGGLRISATSGEKWDAKKYFGSEGSTSPFTHLVVTDDGLWTASDAVIRFSDSHGLDDEAWLSYAPLVDLSNAELADFLVLDARTVLYVSFLENEGEYRAYLTDDLDHWYDASAGLVGSKGGLVLAADDDVYYALLFSGERSFLHRFQNTGLAP